jgi:hypothetical protein
MPLDWNGDGVLDYALVDIASQTWTIRSLGQDVMVPFGSLGSIPAAAR